ncbi:fibronectin type III domain-containing protein [Cellvibrio sp. KY-YJ-3]|uniref:fibronectin type III domain-containing protein n=1 Tax=Cellvibrio sp. KY-YJ-3 TaxID=454662 RepID=UPI001244E5B8|nr:fibronectin type III domain-containing protein [Cellvibrio sp. KY-YJ-3]
MIFSFKKYCTFEFAITGLLTIILTGCGGGGSEGSNTQGNSNSSIPTALPSSTPVVVASSVPISSSAPSSSSLAISVTTSSSAPSSTPIQATKSSSPQSSFSSSSIDNNQPIDDEPPPLQDDEHYEDLPPSAPRALRADIISADGAVLSWNKSTDDTGLARYEIRRNDALIGTSVANNLRFEDTGLKANTYYTYTLRAVDVAGNRSSLSEALIVRTNEKVASTSSKSMNTSSSSTQPTSSSSVSSSSSHHTSSSSSSSKAPDSSSASSNTSSSFGYSSSALQSSSYASSSVGVRVSWVTPTQRENGEYLEFNEIGGYEILYRPSNSNAYVKEIITDTDTTHYERSDIGADTIFQIAVFDKNGLYSRYLQLIPE